MRDAFGGVFMIRLFLVFIVIYVAFTAISLNYAKAYRIKNKVIDFVEKHEINDVEKFFSSGNQENVQKLNLMLDNANYNQKCPNGTFEGYCHRGIIIKKSKEENNAIYYDITTSADWNLGVLNKILALGGQNSNDPINGQWKIHGEAKVPKRKV